MLRVQYFCLLITFICLLLKVDLAFSQSISKDGFFNYSIGNQWKYVSPNSGNELQIEITSCSEGDTLTTCIVENFGELIIEADSVFITDFFASIFPELAPAYLKIYISDFPKDSLWNPCWDCSQGFDWLEYGDGASEGYVSDSVSLPVFDENVLMKTLIIKKFKNDPLGVPAVQIEISEKFGILSIQYYEGDALVLTGARIDGVTFGDLVVTNEKENSNPMDFYVSEAFPNPFNPNTRLEVSVTTQSFVDVKVVDILGRSIMSIPKKIYTQGKHIININLDGNRSGLYFVLVSSENFQLIRKLIKLK